MLACCSISLLSFVNMLLLLFLHSREGSYYGRDVGLLLHLPHSLSRAHTAFWKSFDRVSLALPGVDLIPPPAVAVFQPARCQCVEFFLDCVMSMTPGEIFFLCYRGIRGEHRLRPLSPSSVCGALAVRALFEGTGPSATTAFS